MDGKRFERALVFLLLLGAFLCGFNAIHDHDTWWNLAFGQEILGERSFIREEPFAFTREGAPVTDLSWLFNVTLFAVYDLFGFDGLLVLTGLAAALTMLLLVRMSSMEGYSGAVCLALYFSLFFRFFRSRFRPRPELISLVLFALLLYLLLLYRKDLLRFKWVVALIFLAWVQCHGSWTYGLLTIPFFILEKHGLRFSRAFFSDCFQLGVLPVLALFVNPYGYKPVLFPFTAFSTLRNSGSYSIQEWEPMSVMAFTVPFMAMPAALFLYYGFKALRNRGPWFPAAFVAAQGILTLAWQRYNTFGFIALAYFAVGALNDLSEKGPRLKRFMAAAAPALLLLPFSWILTFEHHGKWMPREYPLEESAFLRDEGLEGNLLHTYEAGGFLELNSSPGFRTYFDGRYFDFLPYYKEYMDARRDTGSFAGFAGKYPFTAAVLPYSFIDVKFEDRDWGVRRSGFAYILPAADWAPVFYGPYGAVFLKRSPGNLDTIRDHEYKVLLPFDEEYMAVRSRLDTELRKEAAMELERAYSTGAPFVKRSE